jgi:preprotein translocase subunit SecG
MLAGAVPTWVSESFPVIQVILVAIVALCAIALIVLVFCQESNSNGLGSLGGAENSFYAQNKGNSREGRLKRWTYILAGVIFIVTVLYLISFRIYSGS